MLPLGRLAVDPFGHYLLGVAVEVLPRPSTFPPEARAAALHAGMKLCSAREQEEIPVVHEILVVEDGSNAAKRAKFGP